MQFGGKVTYTSSLTGGLCELGLQWFDTREEYVERMAEELYYSPDFAPKRWWQFWKTQIISEDVLLRYHQLRFINSE